MRGVRSFALLTCWLAVITIPGVALAASSGGWNNLGPAGAGNQNYGAIEGSVYVLERSGTQLYVGGSFDNAGDIPNADRIAVWSGTAWAAVCPGITGSGAVYSIAIDSQTGRVYAGGSFQNASGDANADGLAVCYGGAWHSLANTPFPANVIALEIVGRKLYVSCGCQDIAGFEDADFVITYNLNAGTFSPIPDTNPDVDGNPEMGAPNDIEADGNGGVYMAGNFINADDIPEADFVVHYDGAGTWSALGSGPAPKHGAIQSQPGQVRGLAVAGNGDLYAVGDFTNVIGTSGDGDKIVKWNGAAWQALGSSFFADACRSTTSWSTGRACSWSATSATQEACQRSMVSPRSGTVPGRTSGRTPPVRGVR